MSDRFTITDVEAHNARVSGRLKFGSTKDGVDREIEGLHHPIIDWCKRNGAPYIRARSDQESTIAKGCQDFTIFYRKHVYCIECKSKTGKRTTEQLAWAMMMETHGFPVHVVTNLQQFFELVRQ